MVSLVIQGPLISKGITGAFLPGKSEYKLVEYDCRKNLDTIIEQYGHLFDHIVICTWKNQEISYQHKGATVLELEDTFGEEYLEIISEPVKKINNKQRQFFSTLKGCEYLESIGYHGNVFKFRTDQIIDFNEAVSFFEKEKDSEKVFIPFFSHKYKTTLYPKIHFSDYYFYGKMKNIKQLCSAQLQGTERTDNPHRDVFFRYAYERFGKELGVDEKYYFGRTSFICKQNARIVAKAYNELFAPMPKKCLTSLIWRGEPISQRIAENIYYEDWITGVKEEYLKAIIESKKVSINRFSEPYLIDRRYKNRKISPISFLIGKYYTYITYFLFLKRKLEFLRRKI